MPSYSSINYRQRSNGVVTAGGAERIRRFIKSREIDLKNVTKRIEEEEPQITSCDNAIYNLELAILDARKILEMHDENLSNLKTQRKRISDISSLLSWNKSRKKPQKRCARNL
jgi:hypothetical protein